MSKKINASRLQKKNHFSCEWVITCEQGTQPSDLTDPNYFCHIANRLNKNDMIRAFFDDGSYIIDLLVLETDKTNLTPLWVKTIITNIIDIEKSKNLNLETKEKPSKKDLEFKDDFISVMFRGPVLKWSVIRNEDKVVLREKLETKEDAILTAQEIKKQINDR
jgi:hypothetical protein